MRTYVVTGATSGIGAATYALLRQQGNRVIGIDRHHSDVNVDLGTAKGRRDGACTVTDLSMGQIDAVITCGDLELLSSAAISLNFFGVKDFIQEALPVLMLSKNPRVVVTSSVASLMPNSPDLVAAMLFEGEKESLAIAKDLCDEGDGRATLISASTARALNRWVRRECINPTWTEAGITLNALAPGVEQSPAEVASLLVWLASEENRDTTGQIIFIDRGEDAKLRGDDIWN